MVDIFAQHGFFGGILLIDYLHFQLSTEMAVTMSLMQAYREDLKMMMDVVEQVPLRSACCVKR